MDRRKEIWMHGSMKTSVDGGKVRWNAGRMIAMADGCIYGLRDGWKEGWIDR